MISAIYLFIPSTAALLFAILYYITKKKLSRINLQDISMKDLDIHKENYIKYLSDSREWAFTYIEDVQSGIKKFVDNVSPEIEYYDKYGIVIEGMITPHDKALKTISKEFKDLKTLLPEEKE